MSQEQYRPCCGAGEHQLTGWASGLDSVAELALGSSLWFVSALLAGSTGAANDRPFRRRLRAQDERLEATRYAIAGSSAASGSANT